MTSKMFMVTLTLSLIFGMTTVGSAFDGNRKGFIIGIGGGPGYTTFNETFKSSFSGNTFTMTSDRQNKLTFMSDFRIGYAPSNLLQIYWMSKVSWFKLKSSPEEDVIIANGFGGVGVTYSFNPTGPSPFITGGLGFSTWALPFEQGTETMTGLGVVAGVGYEFASHWSFEFDLMWGQPDTKEGGAELTINTLSLKFTLNVLAY